MIKNQIPTAVAVWLCNTAIRYFIAT
ncbi:hypothetical protein [Saccharopolyspora sp. 5N708]